MKKKLLCILSAALCAVLLYGCAAVTPPEPADPSQREWTPAEYTMTFGDTDPWEGFNRAMFGITDIGVRYVVRPIGWLWGGILPRPVVRCIDTASDNLCFPARAVSCILQNRWRDSGIELSRFLINLTVGVAGLYDAADYWFDIYQRNEDFGQAFASWGCGPGYTLMLPFLTSTNVRDDIGYVFDYIFDIKTYIPYYVSTACSVNRAVKNFRQVNRLLRANADPYETFKDYAVINRQLAIADYLLKKKLAAYEAREKARAAAEAETVAAETVAESKPAPEEKAAEPPPEPPREPVTPVRPAGIAGRIIGLPEYAPENPWADSVRVLLMQPQTDEASWWVHLSPWNTDFCNQAEERSVRAVFSGADDMDYYFWRSPDPEKYHRAPLVVLFPGVGGHHTNQTAAGLAELLNRQGYAVMLLPSVYCWSFYQSRHTERLPGHTPDDVRVLRQTLVDILTDLREKVREGKRFTPDGLHIVGYSMGGLHTLHLAALEAKDPVLKARRFVAIDPPADLVYALKEIDRCRLAAKGMAREKVVEVMSDAFAKATAAGTPEKPWLDAPETPAPPEWGLREIPVVRHGDRRVELSKQQAELLAAMSFGYALREIMMIACRDRRTDDLEKYAYKWNDRTAFYAKIDAMGFAGYMNELVLPEYRRLYGKERTLDELARASGLYGIEETLKRDQKIAVLHNLNDFLLSETDRRYLDRTLGDRITWFDQGGHLGNMYDGLWQKELLKRLK